MSSHLKLRGSMYYAQKRVPDDVRQAVGTKVLEKSLRTGDKAKANQVKLAVLAEWQEWFESIRRGGDAAVKAPEDLLRYVPKLRKEVEAGRIRPFDAEQTVDSIVDAMRDSTTEADAEIIRQARKALRGQLGPTLQDEVEAFLAERARDVRAQTLGDLKRHLGAFIDWAGPNLECSSVDRKTAGRYVTEVIQRLAVSSSTRIKQVSALRTFYGWLLARGGVDSNPFDRMTTSVKQSKRGKQAARRAWTEAELLRLVQGLDHQHPVWALSVIAMYGGQRREEVGLLRGVDFDPVAGTLQVAEGKTLAAVRAVPVHPVISPLIALLAKRAGAGYLLDGLSPGGPDNKRTWHIGKRFGRDRRKLGLTDSRADFHALRKTFISAALNAGAPLPVVQQCVGHEQEGVTLSVYNQFTPATCRAAVEGVTYGTVDQYVAKTISGIINK